MAGTSKDYDDDDGGGGAIVDINVTPLVDITLVLLIIFMVTAKYIVNPAIEVELPHAASGNQVVQKTLGFTLGKPVGGKPPQLFLNGLEITWEDAAKEVRAQASNKGIQAIVAADRSVLYDDVVKLIDLVKLNGVTNFALSYDPTPVEPPKP